MPKTVATIVTDLQDIERNLIKAKIDIQHHIDESSGDKEWELRHARSLLHSGTNYVEEARGWLRTHA